MSESFETIKMIAVIRMIRIFFQNVLSDLKHTISISAILSMFLDIEIFAIYKYYVNASERTKLYKV